MKLNVIQQPDEQLIQFLSKQIVDFNMANWEVTERLPLAVTATDDNDQIVGGASGITFGNWLLLERLWVSDVNRGNGTGVKLLKSIEQAAIERGCSSCLLDTLNFQAKPFYEKYGYKVEWVQPDYPKTGCKYFMTKALR